MVRMTQGIQRRPTKLDWCRDCHHKDVELRQLKKMGHLCRNYCSVQSVLMSPLWLRMNSEVFAKMFSVPFSESVTNIVNITDFPVIAVKQLLIFVYTGTVDSEMTVTEILDLISIGEKYLIEDIESECSYVIIERVKTIDLCDLNEFLTRCNENKSWGVEYGLKKRAEDCNDFNQLKRLAEVAKHHDLLSVVQICHTEMVKCFPKPADIVSGKFKFDEEQAYGVEDFALHKKRKIEVSTSDADQHQLDMMNYLGVDLYLNLMKIKMSL